jgi:hypothetical protein
VYGFFGGSIFVCNLIMLECNSMSKLAQLADRLDQLTTRLGKLVDRLLRRRDISDLDNSLYLTRWYLLKLPWFSIALHRFVRGDNDRDLHDHPYAFWSLILKGGYWEIFLGADGQVNKVWQRPGKLLRRPATWRHRVELPAQQCCWTLLLRWPTERSWGFWTSEGWVHWRRYRDFKIARDGQ